MTTKPTAGAVIPDLVSLEVIRRTRDALIDALSVTAMPNMADVVVLAELDAECRARAGGTEPDSLSRLLFLTRRRQCEVERRITQARRRHAP